MEIDDEVKIGDLLETPDYIGKVIAVDESYVRLHILQIKSDSVLGMSDFLRDPKHTRPEDQINTQTDYFKDTKLLNVNWKDWMRLNGLLNV